MSAWADGNMTTEEACDVMNAMNEWTLTVDQFEQLAAGLGYRHLMKWSRYLEEWVPDADKVAAYEARRMKQAEADALAEVMKGVEACG